MADDVDFESWSFWTRQAQKQLEFEQEKARAAFRSQRLQTEALMRRDVRAWAQRNADEEGQLRGNANLRSLDRIVEDRMGELLARVQGGGQWPPLRGGVPVGEAARGTVQSTAAAAVRVVDRWRDNVGIDAEDDVDAEEFLRSPEARAVFEDHRVNPVGVRERESRQLRESAARWRASRADLEDVDASLDAWSINQNIWQLSTDSHALAYARSYLARIGEQTDAARYVALVSEEAAKALDPAGRQAQVVFRTFTESDLDRLYRAVNDGRRTYTSWKTLGLGHGTGEVYWPIPESIEDEAQAFFAEARSNFLAGRSPTYAKSASAVARELEAFERRLRRDLEANDSLTPEKRARLLDRLLALVRDLRADTL